MFRYILSLVLLVFSNSIIAAPLPKDPCKITADNFKNTIWNFSYNHQSLGKVYFNENGTYNCTYTVNNINISTFGNWYLDSRNNLVFEDITMPNYVKNIYIIVFDANKNILNLNATSFSNNDRIKCNYSFQQRIED